MSGDPDKSKELERLKDTAGKLPPTVPGKTRLQTKTDRDNESAFQPPHTSTQAAGPDTDTNSDDSDDEPSFYEASTQQQPVTQQPVAAESSTSGPGATGGGSGNGGNEDGGNGGDGNNGAGDNTGEEEENEAEEEEMANLQIELADKTHDNKDWKETVKVENEEALPKVKNLLTVRQHAYGDAKDYVAKVTELVKKVTLTPVELQILKDRVETLEGVKSKLLNVDSSIGDLLDVKSSLVFSNYSMIAESKISPVLKTAYQLLRKGKVEINEDLNTTWPDATLGDEGNIVVGSKTKASTGRSTTVMTDPSKMPRNEHLEDIKFNGKKHDYTRFKLQAKNLFGDSQLYTYVTKFKCLEKVLPDNLKRLAQSQLPTEEGYNQFWQDMDQSFGDTRDTINYWQAQLKTLPTIQMVPTTGGVSVGKLESYYSSAKLIIRKLAEAGAHGNDQHYHMQWMPKLTAHLPPLITVEWWGKYEAMKDDKTKNPIDEYFSYIKTRWLDNSRYAAQAYQQLQNELPQKPAKNGNSNNAKPVKYEQGFTTGTQNQKPVKPADYASTPAKHCYLCIPSGTSTDPPPPAYKHEPKHCKNAPKEDAYARCYKAKGCVACGNHGHIMYHCQNRKKCDIENCEWEHMKSLHNCKYLSYANFRQKKGGRGKPKNKNQ